MERSYAKGSEGRDACVARFTELRSMLLRGIAEQGGRGAESEARSLLDYTIEVVCTDRSDESILIDQVINRSVPFIQQSENPDTRHFRLLGVSHMLVNLLGPRVERTDDEYITSRYEELRDRLFGLERVNGASPSLDNRLESIYNGLVELANALGMTTCNPMCL